MADNSAEMAHLLAGYKRFREGTYAQNQERFESLASAQSPKAAIVCCCDSRADPSMILDVNPGELFVIRNVANLVPPYETDGAYHGTSAALEFAVEGLHIKDIIVMGTSLGGAAAVYLTAKQCQAKKEPAALVAVATFSSMVQVAGSHYPWLPVGAVLVDRYPSANRIPHVTCPVLMFHGDQDRVVQQRFGIRLFEATPDKSKSGVPKRWIDLPGVGHNNIVHLSARTIASEIADITRRAQR